MAKIKVNSIVNRNDDGATELKFGASIPAGQSISGSGNINIVGVVTATSFSGNGSDLTGLIIATASKTIAFKKILGYDEYRS